MRRVVEKVRIAKASEGDIVPLSGLFYFGFCRDLLKLGLTLIFPTEILL